MIHRSYGALVTCTLFLAGCASHMTRVPANVFIDQPARSSVAAPVASADAPPKIVSMAFSSLDVPRGSVWRGSIVTATNVASVEIRTNLFSIDVPRTAFGHFALALNIFDTPPIFVRAYRLRVIARNASGMQSEEDLPFRIR
ncbi:MAG: hypothetical protein ACYDGM_03640 [Vulcanimicrobiaceae bacterium]